MDRLSELVLLAEEANGQYSKFLTGENIKAAIRCRKILSELRKTATEARINILKKQKEINLERYLKNKT